MGGGRTNSSRSGAAAGHTAGAERSRSPYAEWAGTAGKKDAGDALPCGHERGKYDGGCPECRAHRLREADNGELVAAAISSGTIETCGHPGDGLSTMCGACMTFAERVTRIYSDERISAEGRRIDGEAWPIPTWGVADRLTPLPGLTVQELAKMRRDPVIIRLMEGGPEDDLTLTLHQAREAHVCLLAMLEIGRAHV